MASHHQPYHPCHQPPPTSGTTTCYCYCYYSSCPPSHHPLPPVPHLSSVAHPPQPHFFSPYTPQTHHYHPPQSYSHLPNHLYFQEPPHHQHQYYHKEELTPPLVTSSLLRRISALEAALKRHSSSSTASLYSLRDAAARTIQNHFRSFLVRRSRTLGQLKELAAFKSTLNALKSSISENTHLDSQAITVEAMDLLLKLDSIQGGDPMIRDGKRSISRELIRLVEFADGVSVKWKDHSSRIVKNVRCGGDSNNSRDFCISKKRANTEDIKVGKLVEEIERLRERIETINGPSRALEEDSEEDEALESPVVSLVRKSGVSNTEGRGNVIEKLKGLAERDNELSRVTEDDDEKLEAPAVSLVGKNKVSVAKTGGLIKGRAAQAKVKRNVTFVMDQNVYRVLGSNNDLIMNGGDSDYVHGSNSIDEPQLIRHLVRRGEEIGLVCKETGNEDEEDETEEEGSPQSADAEKDANNTRKNNVIGESHDHDEDGDFVFCAPVPAKMEARADLMNKRESLKM